jgi:hypothetical protein
MNKIDFKAKLNLNSKYFDLNQDSISFQIFH